MRNVEVTPTPYHLEIECEFELVRATFRYLTALELDKKVISCTRPQFKFLASPPEIHIRIPQKEIQYSFWSILHRQDPCASTLRAIRSQFERRRQNFGMFFTLGVSKLARPKTFTGYRQRHSSAHDYWWISCWQTRREFQSSATITTTLWRRWGVLPLGYLMQDWSHSSSGCNYQLRSNRNVQAQELTQRRCFPSRLEIRPQILPYHKSGTDALNCTLAWFIGSVINPSGPIV